MTVQFVVELVFSNTRAHASTRLNSAHSYYTILRHRIHVRAAVHFNLPMAADTAEAQPRTSLDFVESSVLEAIVPAKSKINIKDAIESWDGAADDNGSILPFLAQRQVLLLGMCSASHQHLHVSYSYVGF